MPPLAETGGMMNRPAPTLKSWNWIIGCCRLGGGYYTPLFEAEKSCKNTNVHFPRITSGLARLSTHLFFPLRFGYRGGGGGGIKKEWWWTCGCSLDRR